MAVVITSKFYQADAWKDISKVVFTSPNMDSPATAGTRSHILPGEGALGTWYEDTSMMYRIEDHQWETDSDFYNYRMKLKDDVDTSTSPEYIEIVKPNYNGIDTYIKENSGVAAIDYTDSTGYIGNTATRLEYTPLQNHLDEINSAATDLVTEIVDLRTKDCDASVNTTYTITGTYSSLQALPGTGISTGASTTSTHASYKKSITRNHGWFTEIIDEIANCYVTFEFSAPIKITSIEMDSISYTTKEEIWDDWDSSQHCEDLPTEAQTVNTTSTNYFIGNYTIEGSSDGSTWTTLYTGSNSNNTSKRIYLSNTQYWLYYRLNITNNSSLNTSTFDRTYYGVRNLRFYTYEYSSEQGSSSVALYNFKDDNASIIIKVSNALAQEGTSIENSVISSDQDIVGQAIMTIASGTTVSGLVSTYNVALNSSLSEYDYLTTASCEATTISGIGNDSSAQTYIKEDSINVAVDAQAELYDLGIIDNYMMFSAQGTTTLPIDTADWVGTADITYTTVASGTVISGSNIYPLTGYTTRTYETHLRARRASYRLVTDEFLTTTGAVASGTITSGTNLYMWGYNSRPLDLDTSNSIIFEITTGEAYNCRLTAWDDVTHSTLLNELIANDHVRCSAMAFCGGNNKLDPTNLKGPVNLIYPPAHNKIFKGNTVYEGTKLYYGDFDLVYRYETDVFGDFLMFKPMLYGIDTNVSYGVHDYVITLHYSYT